jgi:hypothetical protein
MGRMLRAWHAACMAPWAHVRCARARARSSPSLPLSLSWSLSLARCMGARGRRCACACAFVEPHAWAPVGAGARARLSNPKGFGRETMPPRVRTNLVMMMRMMRMSVICPAPGLVAAQLRSLVAAATLALEVGRSPTPEVPARMPTACFICCCMLLLLNVIAHSPWGRSPAALRAPHARPARCAHCRRPPF